MPPTLEDPRTEEPGASAEEPQLAIGARLRRIRQQQAMSLADVEERSGGTWKAVVVGAYERGDRAVSVERLAGLAGFYGVPPAELLPPAPAEHTASPSEERYVIDLVALESDTSPEAETVSRFAHRVRLMRGDHNGRVLTVRASDIHNLAAAAGLERDSMVAELRDHGVLREPG